jgi:hypothetical protein
VRRFVGKVHRLGVHRPAGARDGHRLPGDCRGGLRGEVDAGGEAPGPVDYDAHGEAELGGFPARLDSPVAEPDALLAQALQPEFGVGGTEGLRCGQRGVGEGFSGQDQEVRSDRMAHPASLGQKPLPGLAARSANGEVPTER